VETLVKPHKEAGSGEVDKNLFKTYGDRLVLTNIPYTLVL
jgi:hypothetical protein